MTSDVPGKLSSPAFVRLGLAAALAVGMLALAGGARANAVGAGIDLGTVSVLGDTVLLSGSVDDTAANLSINGKPVTLNGAGAFSTVVTSRVTRISSSRSTTATRA